MGLRLLSSYLFLHVRLLDTSLLELNLMYFTLVQVTLFDCLLYTLFHSFPLYITGGPFTMVWLTFYSYSTLLYSTFFHFFSLLHYIQPRRLKTFSYFSTSGWADFIHCTLLSGLLYSPLRSATLLYFAMRYSTFFYLTLLLIFYSYSVLFHSTLFCSAFGLHTSELLSTRDQCAVLVCKWTWTLVAPHPTTPQPHLDMIMCSACVSKWTWKLLAPHPAPPLCAQISQSVCVCAQTSEKS